MAVLSAIPNPGDLFNPGAWVDKVVEGFLALLAKGTIALLGSMLGWFSRVTEADVTRPWALDVYGRAIAVVASLGVLLLIISAAAGAARRGPAGALEPLGRLGAACLWIGFVRVLVDVLQQLGDALTVWLAPDLQGDVQRIMAAMTTWPAAAALGGGLMVWWLLALLAFVAVLIMAVQLFIRKYAILILWAVAPFVGIFSIADRGFTLLKRHSVTLVAVILAKPLMAFVISLIAAPLVVEGGKATLDEGMMAVAGLGVAAFAPWVLLAAVFKTVSSSVGRGSKAGDPVSGTRKAVSTATGPSDVVRSIRARHEAYTGGHQANQKAWDRNRPMARGAAAAGAAAATGGAAVPAAAASAAKSGAAKAKGVATNGVRVATVPGQQYQAGGGQVSREFGERSGLLVADKAGRVVDVGAHVPAEPAGLGPNERLAWRREHLTHDEPTPAQPPPPRRAPNPKEGT